MSRVKPKHVLMLNGKPVSRRDFFKRRLGGAGVAMLGRRTLPMSGNTVEGYSVARSVNPEEVPLMNFLLAKEPGGSGAYYDATKPHNCRILTEAGSRAVTRILNRMHGGTKNKPVIFDEGE